MLLPPDGSGTPSHPIPRTEVHGNYQNKLQASKPNNFATIFKTTIISIERT